MRTRVHVLVENPAVFADRLARLLDADRALVVPSDPEEEEGIGAIVTANVRARTGSRDGGSRNGAVMRRGAATEWQRSAAREAVARC